MKSKNIEQSEIKNSYISKYKNFENNLNGHQDIPFHKTRQDAIQKFEELGFPTTRIEEWKYTNVDPILKHDFSLVEEPADISETQLKKHTFEGLNANLLVFINGKYASDLSIIHSEQKNLVISSLQDALKNNNKVVEKYLSKYLDYQNEAFAALNTAFALDGAFVYVPDGMILEEPIHLLNLTTDGDTAFQAHPRNLFVFGKGSQAKIIETHDHSSENLYFHNAVSEFIVEDDAIINHVKVQDESKNAYRIATMQVNQGHRSVFTTISMDLGGALVRNNTNMVLHGENCESNLYGFYLVNGTQHIDNHTNIDHAKPNCNSNELFKGILADKARGVFSGTIYVRPDAQKTNAFQSNKNLLLSEEAEIDSKPQLKIYADDVKCSHGATIGELDKEALFYLRQRGLSEAEANAMLRYAFAADVFSRIKIDPVREMVDAKVNDRFKAIY